MQTFRTVSQTSVQKPTFASSSTRVPKCSPILAAKLNCGRDASAFPARKRCSRATISRVVRSVAETETAVRESSAPEMDAYEAQVVGMVKQTIAKAGDKIPKELMFAFLDLYATYKKAVLSGNVPGNDEKLVAAVMASIANCVMGQFIDPYIFPSYHDRILAPYNYYDFGQNYVRPLIDFSTSVLGHPDRFDTIQAQLDAGHNVVLLANHQTEADPGVFALLLEKTHPKLATDVIYVAGDRVITDALCKPFTMGRNVYCVHSKKHLNDFPELTAQKSAMNRRTLQTMLKGLNEGGKLLWIAPSGGRDRADADTGLVTPDPFDPSAVELMRAMLAKSKPEGHLYPFAMYSTKIMPPPNALEKSVGERRITGFSGVGISVGPELDPDTILEGIEGKEARSEALSAVAFKEVCREYDEIVNMILANADPASPSYKRLG